MAKILIVYSSVDGHTAEICRRISEIVQRHSHQAVVSSIDAVEELDAQAYDKIVIGASIRYGKHSRRVAEFVTRNRQMLDSKPSAFFSVNAVARKPGKDRLDTNPYAIKFLRKVNWKPRLAAVFAGKINYPKYMLFDRMIIRLIMWMTSGPTDLTGVFEFTDWQQVEDFANLVEQM